MKELVIHVRNFDGLANRMFRYMFAEILSMKTGGLKVTGFNMPEWGLVSPDQDIPSGRSLTIGPRHKIDVQHLVEQIQSGNFDWIDVDCYAMRLEYFEKEREHFANTFRSPLGEEIQGDEILIHVRTGDIVNGQHADYAPIPLAYYHRIIFETGMKPVFIGQLTGNWYVDALHRQFPHARYIEGDVVSDFQTIRRSKTVMIAVSSFSWLASFLSTEATQIHMPIAGIFNPDQRPDVDLMPTSDSRYYFHRFPTEKYAASEKQIAILSSSPAWARALPRPDAGYMGLQAGNPQPRILSAEDVGNRIWSATQDGRPFCYVQLGDGEGNLLKLDCSTAADTDLCYFQNHFGENTSLEAMLAIKEGLNRTVNAADLIGLRDDIWLATNDVSTLNESDPDFFQRFRSEFPLRASEKGQIDEYGARRVFRLFAWAREFYPSSIDACSQWANCDLALAGFWHNFFSSQENICLIHCSPHLPAKLKRALGVNVESIIIPDKAISRTQWAEVFPDHEPHYPDVFLRIRDQLNRPAAGKVFLVGAGLAGKEYLKIIKDNGGIALDLGALLDAWDGRATRPLKKGPIPSLDRVHEG